MQSHLNQSSHNLEFHKKICELFPNNYFDWKITCLFYTGYHYIKAYYKNKGIDIGNNHVQIEKNINPKIQYAPYKVDTSCWNSYKALFRYCHTARYDGLSDFITFNKSLKKDHKNCIEHLKGIELYLKKHKFNIKTLTF